MGLTGTLWSSNFEMRILALCGLAVVVAACGGIGEGDGAANASELSLFDLPVRLPAETVAGTFDQVIDHADDGIATNPGDPPRATFRQRYWYNPGFATGPSSPVLFFICGEAECYGEYAMSLADTAKQLSAAIVVLEHRYYGMSMPVENPTTTDQMTHLTIANAVEDLASFQRYATTKHSLLGKWIAAGGSYPGMLAAYYRLKHPELVVGAWASSAPVDVRKSFMGYDASASRALGPTCSLLLRQAQTSVRVQSADPTKKRELLEKYYGMEVSPEQVDRFDAFRIVRYIAHLGQGAAQYGRTHALCSALSQHEADPLEGVFAYIHPPFASEAALSASNGGATVGADAGSENTGSGGGALAMTPGGSPVIPGFPALLPPGVAPASSFLAPAAGAAEALHSWRYQVCSEVGFYQVANIDRTQSIIPEERNEESGDRECMSSFGRTPNIEATRATYFEPLRAGLATNLFFTNGEHDPWATLSFTDPSAVAPGVTAMVIRGGSHCEDLQNLYSGALVGIFEAHKRFVELARGWLAR